MTRVATLEFAVDGAMGEGRLRRLRRLKRDFGFDVFPSFRLVYGHIAAACAVLADLATCDNRRSQVRLYRLFTLRSLLPYLLPCLPHGVTVHQEIACTLLEATALCAGMLP